MIRMIERTTPIAEFFCLPEAARLALMTSIAPETLFNAGAP